MGVTESDLDPTLKNAHNILVTVRKIGSACDLVAEMLLILKNIFFDLIIQGQVLDITSKEMSHDFVWGQSVAETFRHNGAHNERIMTRPPLADCQISDAT